MKQGSLKILFIALLFITACKKDRVTTPLQHDLAGSWELHKSYVYTNVSGGVIDYAPGNGNTITFNSNGRLSQTIINPFYSNVITGKYTLQTEDNCGINLLIIKDSSMEADKYQIAVYQDTLVMGAGSCIADAISAIYLRKK